MSLTTETLFLVSPPARSSAEPGTPLPRVLLVDDDETVRTLTRLLLKRSRRFEVVAEAADGPEGITQAGLYRPDLVMLDLDMPVMGGLEALPKILKASPNSRVVMFSGRALEGADLYLRLGASACAGKQEEWADVVKKLLSVVSAMPAR